MTSLRGQFAERLRVLMSEKRVSAQELSERTGLTPTAVSIYRSGDWTPSIETIGRVSDALEVSPEYFFSCSAADPGRDFCMAKLLLARSSSLWSSNLRGYSYMAQKYQSIKEGTMSAATLKYIAILSMLMDHIWVSLFNRSEAFIFMHYFGRLAFPIFCFLLVEGYRHTRDVQKYMMRLFVFALISEVPYDLFLYGEISMKGCNVLFTLLLGLIAIYAWDHFSKKSEYAEAIAACIAAMFVATLIKADYLFLGVALIACIHIAKEPMRDILSAGILYAAGSGWGIPAIGLMHLYNGEKGHQWKWFFYIFYPVHLAILAAMSGI